MWNGPSAIANTRLGDSPVGLSIVYAYILEVSVLIVFIFFNWSNSPQMARAFSFTRFLHHTQRRTTVGRTPLDE